MRRGISQHTIPQALYEAGLAPADVVRPTCPPGAVWRHLPADGNRPSRYVDWEPHRHIAECWYLVERYQMALIPDTLSGTWHLIARALAPGAPGTAVRFAELPMAICRLALQCHQHRADDEAAAVHKGEK
jgi:hypothetical protein